MHEFGFRGLHHLMCPGLAAIIIQVRSSPSRQCTKIFLFAFSRVIFINRANTSSLGKGQHHGKET